MSPELSPRQSDVLKYITAYIAVVGYPPTIREIGQALGIRSTNGVNDHLVALENKGYIRRAIGRARAITIMESPAGNA